MFTPSKILLIAGGALIAGAIAHKIAAGKKLDFSIGRIGYALAPAGISLTVYIIARNPSPVSFTLNSLEGQIFVNDDKAGFARVEPMRIIEPNGVTTVPLSVLVSYQPVVDFLVSLFSGAGVRKFTQIQIAGSAKVDDLPFPFTVNYSL